MSETETEKVVAVIDSSREPAPCENCGDEVVQRFYKDCVNCNTDMLVCEDCLQEWVETAHDNCEQ